MSALLLLALALPRADPPLPEGAIARLGSPAWRNVADTRSFISFSSDGNSVIVAHEGTLRCLDFESGRENWKVGDIRLSARVASVGGDRLVVYANRRLRLFNAGKGVEEKALPV